MIGFATEKEKKIIHKEVMPEIEWIPNYAFVKKGFPVLPISMIPFLCVGLLIYIISFFGFLNYVLGNDIIMFHYEETKVWLAFFICCSIVFLFAFKSLHQYIKSFRERYDELEKKGQGYIRIVSKRDMYGICNSFSGKELLPPVYKFILRNKNLYKIYDSDGKWGIFNTANNKIIVPCSYDRIEYDQFLSNIKAYCGEECHLYAANGTRKS